MADWRRRSIAGVPSPGREMADWRRRSIAGGPSPATPNEDIPGALHLDPIAFPCDGAGGTCELEAAIMPTRGFTIAIPDWGFLLPAADGDRRMAAASPATTDEGSPLQPRQCQPVGTAATGGGGSRRRLSWSPDVSGGRVSCPSSSQLPPLRDHAAICFVDGEAVSLWCSENFQEDIMPYLRNDDNEQATSSGRSDEAPSSERGDKDDEATSSERGEDDDEADEEDEDGNMSPERNDDDDEQDEEDMLTESEDGAMSPERNDDDDEQDEEDMLTESDDEEEEEPEAPPECVNCGSMEKLVMLVPCRHPCYCALCFRLAEWRTGPAGVRCPVCGVKCTRGHPQCGRLGPKPK